MASGPSFNLNIHVIQLDDLRGAGIMLDGLVRAAALDGNLSAPVRAKILVARLEDLGDSDITSKWQRCDLYADGEQTEITVGVGGPPAAPITPSGCGTSPTRPTRHHWASP